MKKILIIPFLFFGCVQYTSLTKTAYDPIDFDAVQIFTTEKDIPEDFEKVAIIEIPQANKFKYEEAKEYASKIGCNGVIMTQYFRAGFLEKWLLNGGDEATFIAGRFKVNGEYPKKGKSRKSSYDDLYN